MPKISKLQAREILDSRGVPALEVELTLNGEFRARASVPSGASTGQAEALELRDQDSKRFFGKGLLKSLSHIADIFEVLKERPIEDQNELDALLKNMDGTKDKSRLGANTILAVSLAYAKAFALLRGNELYEDIGPDSSILPVPLINILNGGAHADNNLDIQEFMIVPYGFSSFKSALRSAAEIFYCLKSILKEKGLSTSVGDEGGAAPDLKNNEQAIELLLKAVKKAGYSPEKQVGLALDSAASEFYKGGFYHWENNKIQFEELMHIYKIWCLRYPLLSIEDPLSESDWEGWTALTKDSGQKVQLMGDDLFVTSESLLAKGIQEKAGNSLLAKINQTGTLSETERAIMLAHRSGYTACLSHRSGETEEDSIADLAVAWGAEQIKAGSVCRGERVIKYNRLLRIEERLEEKAEYAGSRAFAVLNR